MGVALCSCAVARFVRLEIALSLSEMIQARVSRFDRAIGNPEWAG